MFTPARTAPRRRPARMRLLWALPAALSSLLLAACLAPPLPGLPRDDLLTWLDVRPLHVPVAVGLLAPFEGLERRAGYRALEDLRLAMTLAAQAPQEPQPALLPFALDTSRASDRAAQKVLLEPSLAGLLGPLSPHSLPAASTNSRLHSLGAGRWLAPFALTERGFTAPDDPAWLEALLEGAARAAAAEGATRLLVAGWDPPPAMAPREGISPSLPVVWQNGPHAELRPAAGEALLWLGSGAGAAEMIASLQAAGSSASVWLAPWAANALLVESLDAQPTSAARAQPLYTLAWQDADFAAWATANPAAPPAEYAQWAAALQLVAADGAAGELSAAPVTPLAPGWFLAAYRLDANGDRFIVRR